MPGKTVILLIILYCLALQGQPVQYNTEFRANTYTENFQDEPSVSGLSDGGFVVCWTSTGQVQSADIFGQRYDDDGSPIGEEFLVNSSTFNNQSQPAVTGLNSGGFIIVWRGQFDDASSPGIFGQLFNTSGTKNGGQFQINTFTTGTQDKPAVCGLSDNGFAVCWVSDRQDGDETGIFGQVFDDQGKKRGEEFQVNIKTESWQWSPKVCALPDEKFVVTWESEDQYELGIRMGIYARCFNSGGIALTEEIIVRSSFYSSARFPDICSLSDEGFVICWDGHEQNLLEDGYEGIIGQMFDSTGTAMNEEFLVNQENPYLGQTLPAICALTGGGFVISWESFSPTGNGSDIYAKLYDKNAREIGSEFRVNSSIDNMQQKTDISGLSDGGFITCWQSMGQDGSLWGIYAKYFLANQIVHSLQSYSLLSPSDDAIVQTTTVNFSWQTASPVHTNFPWELTYKFYLDTTEDFNDPEIFNNIYDSLLTVNYLIPGQIYFWKVLASTYEGDSLWSSDAFGFYINQAEALNAVHTINSAAFNLNPNYPNPFNPVTHIEFSLPKPEFVTLTIYNSLGDKIATLVDDKLQAGNYTYKFDGSRYASGIYYYKINAGRFQDVKKMVLIK